MDLQFFFTRESPEVRAPTRAHADDAGFDVEAIALSHVVGDVEFYKTGLRVMPPPGIYFDLVARSSISKTGYMLANGVGIIDSGYRGEILIALRRMTPSASLELPCKIAQLVPRRFIELRAVEADTLDVTERGMGGFGSTSTSGTKSA